MALDANSTIPVKQVITQTINGNSVSTSGVAQDTKISDIIAAGTQDIPAVPGSFADLAAVQTYLVSLVAALKA